MSADFFDHAGRLRQLWPTLMAMADLGHSSHDVTSDETEGASQRDAAIHRGILGDYCRVAAPTGWEDGGDRLFTFHATCNPRRHSKKRSIYGIGQTGFI